MRPPAFLEAYIKEEREKRARLKGSGNSAVLYFSRGTMEEGSIQISGYWLV